MRPAFVNRTTIILGIALALLAGGFFAGHADAAALKAAILSPSPNGVYLKETHLAFELQFTDGAPGNYKIEWDLNDQDSLEYEVVVQNCMNVGSVTYPLRYDARPSFRVKDYSYLASMDDGEHVVKLKVRQYIQADINCLNAIATSESTISIFLTDDLRFTGYSWLGASTGACSGGPTEGAACDEDNDCGIDGACVGQNDAQGWTSFNCANLGICSSPPELLNSYAVQAIHSDSPNFCKIQNAGWQGHSSTETGSPPPESVGWLTFNKGTCKRADGNDDGRQCDPDAVPDPCGVESSCEPTMLSNEAGVFPGGVVEENWNNASEYVHMYSSYTTVDGVARVPGQISGWGRFLTLRDYGTQQTPARYDWGWTHLRGPLVTPTPTPGEGRFQQCVDCSGGATAIASEVKCNVCNGWLDDASDVQQYACNSCYDCDTTDSNNIKCRSCERCNKYGVSFDAQRTQLTGFGWTGDQDDDEYGFGWMEFDPARGGVSILQAWLATRFGDIFVGGDITAGPLRASPASQYNATYVIQANGEIALTFSSRIGERQADYPRQITLPSQETRYINVLGRLNLDEMKKIGANRFGTTVDVLGGIPGIELDDYLNALPSLGGNIYYYGDDVTLNDDITLKVSEGQSGAGTIIVDGDLTVDHPTCHGGTSPPDTSCTTDDDCSGGGECRGVSILYDSVTPSTLTELPSVGWIVLGDMKIDPQVGAATDYTASTSDPNIVGAFLVLGRADGSSEDLCGSEEPAGVVCTGTHLSQTVNDLELIVSGMMMARKFKFERRGISPQGSEQVVYDGRFIANPPPGLQDLTAVLPSIRSVAP